MNNLQPHLLVLVVLVGVFCRVGWGQGTSCETAEEVFLGVPLFAEVTEELERIDLGFCGVENEEDVGELVFRFVAPSAGTFFADTCDSLEDLDSKISVYSGSCDALDCVDGNDDYCGLLSGVSFTATSEGKEFFILVHSYVSSVGTFFLTITRSGSEGSFTDTCNTAETLSLGTNTGTKSPVHSSLLEDLGRCGTPVPTGHGDVPFHFTAPSSGRYQIVSLSSGYVTVFRDCESPVCVSGLRACVTNLNGEGDCQVHEFAATFEANAGDEFLVIVHSLDSYSPPIVEVSSFEFDPTPCLDAIDVSEDNLPIVTSGMSGDFSGFVTCGAVHQSDATDVFFRFVAPQEGTYGATTCGSSTDFETRISLYSGCSEESECLTGNEGWCDSHSFVEFNAESGQEFFIMVHSYGSSVDEFNFDVFQLRGCDSAPLLEVGKTIQGNSGEGYDSGFPGCGNFNYKGLDNLYIFVPEVDGLYNVRTCSNYFGTDTQISVYRGTCESFSCVIGNDDFCGFRSSVDFLARVGEQFIVMVHGYGGDYITFNLTTEFLVPFQESCEDAYPLSFGEYIRGDTGLGRVTDFPTCGGVKNDPWSPDVFYHFIAPAAGQYQVDTCPGELISPSDTKISVFSGECDEPVCIGGNDDSGRNCGFGSEVFFEANEAGQKFIIMVHAFRRNTGQYRISVGSADDLCSLATEIFVGPYIMGNTLTDGVKNDLIDCGIDNNPVLPDVLYRFRAPESRRYTVSTCPVDTPTDTKLSIYAFCGDTCLNGNDDDACGGYKSRASFIASAGSEYLIRVEPWSAGDSGPYGIEIIEEEEDEYLLGEIEQPQATTNRPQLLDSSLHIREAQIMNHQFVYAQAILDFDQKLFLNEPLMCPFAERSCDEVPLSCDSCNWDQVSASCWGSDCCSEPCSEEEDEGFIFVPLSSQSELIVLNSSDSQYFRFILDDSSLCAPVQISIEAEYGNAQLLVSNTNPYPRWEDRLTSEGKYAFGYVASDPTFHYGQSSLTLCPNPFFAQGYEHSPGIYSVGVFALANTAFRLSISVGTHHPIPQPAERVSCDDVPEIEFEIARGPEGSMHDVICLEDSITKVVHLDYPVVDLSNQVILPFPAGCHVATFTATGMLLDFNDFEPADVYCFSTIDDEIVQINTSVVGRRKNDRDFDAITFTACSDDPFYVHCSYHFWKAEYYTLLFSTTAVPKRTPLIDVRPGPLAMSSGIGAVASSLQGELNRPCVDWQKDCNEFLTPSITDPQPHWPPSGDMWIVTGHFDFPLPSDKLVELRLAAKMENRVTFIRYLSKANTKLLTSESLLGKASLSVIAITNEEGMPVALPNDGKKNKKKRQEEQTPQSYLDYVPNIAYSSLNEEYFPSCDLKKYKKHQNFVDLLIADILPEEKTNFADVIPYQYILEVYNQAYARTSCVAAAAEFLETETRPTVTRGQTSCQYPLGSLEWADDPCCNAAVVPVACCAPYTVTIEDTVYTNPDSDDLNRCSSYDCAESYLNDFADSLNTITDPVIGCASGVLRPEEEMREVIEKQMNNVLRACTHTIGLGDPYRGGFTGVECSQDSECSSGTCNRYLGVCHLPDHEELGEAMLKCYISRMSSLTEDYLREHVLDSVFEKYSRESDEFFEAVKAAATHNDCVNTENALDFSQMTHKKLDVSQECAENYTSTLSPYTDFDLIPKKCAPQYCLGDICRYDKRGCYEECGEFSEFFSSEASCSMANEEVVCSIDIGDCDGRSVCAFCPDNGGKCESVGAYSEEECNNLFMCVLPNGTRYVTNNKEECESQKECSVDCVGNQCRGRAPGRGACLLSPPNGISFDHCEEAGGINTAIFSEADPICLMKEISTSEECLSEPDRVWETCETLEVDSCTYENFTPGQAFLGCKVDIFKPCENEAECLSAGRCSDIDFYRSIASGFFLEPNPVPEKESRVEKQSRAVKRGKGDGFQNGVCLTSGTHLVDSVSGSRIPYCAFGKESPFGCIEDAEEEACDGFIEYFGSFWRWRTWVTPALSEEECLANTFGHSGCQLSSNDVFHQWGWNEEDCDCRLGSYGNTWTWTPGQWVGGQARPLKWMEASVKPPVYEFKETLDYWALADWVRQSAVTRFTDSVKSQIICEANLLTSSLDTILCDCVADDEDNCYEQSTTSIEVGIRDVCAGEVSILKGPSNNILFHESSVKSRCTIVELGMLRKSAFAVSRDKASVSFQFDTPAQPGVVLNQKGATVGKLFGDGAVLLFEKPKLVRNFRACLRITVDEAAEVKDFGYTIGSVIHPLGLDIEVEEESFLEFWCAEIKRDSIPTTEDDAIQIFPISRSDNWEDEDDETYSESSIALVHTLGALYCFDLLLLALFLTYLAFRTLRAKDKKKSVPVVAWIGAILSVLCIFRIIFCFLWPSGGFDDNSLAEYIIFEIPTFLLFSVVILCLSFFRNLSRTKTFFVKETDKTLMILTGTAIFLVWCLFAVVAIVYAEVILEDNEATSECPGRVEATSNLDEETRTLSIVYQSIVIVFTFILAVLFFYSSYNLFKLTEKKTQTASTFVFRLGSILVLSFLLRCVLFIILLALDIASAPYLFCTLFFTEVLMIFLIQFEFNKHFYHLILESASAVMSRTSTNSA